MIPRISHTDKMRSFALWLTPAARLVSIRNQLIPRSGILLLILVLHLVHAAAGGIMKALGVGIQDIRRDFCRRFAALLREGAAAAGFSRSDCALSA